MYTINYHGEYDMIHSNYSTQSAFSNAEIRLICSILTALQNYETLENSVYIVENAHAR